MPLLKSDADKLLGKTVTMVWKQTYNNGRSEIRRERGKVLKVTDNSIEVSGKPMSFGGFGHVPTSTIVGFDKIIEVK